MWGERNPTDIRHFLQEMTLIHIALPSHKAKRYEVLDEQNIISAKGLLWRWWRQIWRSQGQCTRMWAAFLKADLGKTGRWKQKHYVYREGFACLEIAIRRQKPDAFKTKHKIVNLSMEGMATFSKLIWWRAENKLYKMWL